MRKIIIVVLSVLLLVGCGDPPKSFSPPTPTPTIPVTPASTPTPAYDPLEPASFSGDVLYYSDGWRTINVDVLVDFPSNIDELKTSSYSNIVYIIKYAGIDDRFPSVKASNASGCDIHYTAVIDDLGSEKEIFSAQIPRNLVDLVFSGGAKKSLKYYEYGFNLEIDSSIPE